MVWGGRSASEGGRKNGVNLVERYGWYPKRCGFEGE